MTSLARLCVLDFGLFRVFGSPDSTGVRPVARTIGIPGYLIQTQDGKNILVDCGFRAGYGDDCAAASNEDRLGEFGELVAFTPKQLASGQLQTLALTPGDIDWVVLTHTHIDHIGGLGAFTHCPVVLHRAEHALPRPLYFDARSTFDWPAVRNWQLVSGDETLLPGLQLIHTPGHSPGHLSLLLSLPKTGAVLLTGDAIDRASQFDEGCADALTLHSAQRLHALAATQNAFVIYGHDPHQWPLLRKAPTHYD